jgi:hypothetical protein
MDDDQKLSGVAIITHGSLYLAGVYAAGIATGHPWAWKLALASMGVAYIGESLQYAVPFKYRLASLISYGASVILGALAGIALI